MTSDSFRDVGFVKVTGYSCVTFMADTGQDLAPS